MSLAYLEDRLAIDDLFVRYTTVPFPVAFGLGLIFAGLMGAKVTTDWQADPKPNWFNRNLNPAAPTRRSRGPQPRREPRPPQALLGPIRCSARRERTRSGIISAEAV